MENLFQLICARVVVLIRFSIARVYVYGTSGFYWSLFISLLFRNNLTVIDMLIVSGKGATSNLYIKEAALASQTEGEVVGVGDQAARRYKTESYIRYDVKESALKSCRSVSHGNIGSCRYCLLSYNHFIQQINYLMNVFHKIKCKYFLVVILTLSAYVLLITSTLMFVICRTT